MDERTWSKARNLASAYSEAYDEDVAVVLGDALLEVLADLLVPEEDKPYTCLGCNQKIGEVHSVEECESMADAKRQHPAYQPAPSEMLQWARGKADKPSHPDFLEGEAAYEAAPVGTIAGRSTGGVGEVEKRNETGWFFESTPVTRLAFAHRRPVLRWGNP